MCKGWAGNRYHEQHAMLSVPFRLTYFSTRNSSTQVSASNPVLLFHCSCHGAQDRRRKRGERSAGTRCSKFTRALPLLLLLSGHITELLKAHCGGALWELSQRQAARVYSFLMTTVCPLQLGQSGNAGVCLAFTSSVHCLVFWWDPCGQAPLFICCIYIYVGVKNWVGVETFMSKLLVETFTQALRSKFDLFVNPMRDHTR